MTLSFGALLNFTEWDLDKRRLSLDVPSGLEKGLYQISIILDNGERTRIYKLNIFVVELIKPRTETIVVREEGKISPTMVLFGILLFLIF